MALSDLLIAYKLDKNTNIAQQDGIDSISPDMVAEIGTDLADILLGELPKQNRFAVTSGSEVPVGGVDTDMYYRPIATGTEIYRNIGGTWTLLTTILTGTSLEDGILVGLRTSLKNDTVTVSPGSWIIDNVKYTKGVQTEFTLEAKDTYFDRWDLIYADANSNVLIKKGTPLPNPLNPVLPDNCIFIDLAYVPAIGDYGLMGGEVLSFASGYRIHTIVLFSDKFYKSLIENNKTVPGTDPTKWKDITDQIAAERNIEIYVSELNQLTYPTVTQISSEDAIEIYVNSIKQLPESYSLSDNSFTFLYPELMSIAGQHIEARIKPYIIPAYDSTIFNYYEFPITFP